jgi:hypothetical protein
LEPAPPLPFQVKVCAFALLIAMTKTTTAARNRDTGKIRIKLLMSVIFVSARFPEVGRCRQNITVIDRL